MPRGILRAVAVLALIGLPARAEEINLTQGRATLRVAGERLTARFVREPGITNFPDPTCAAGGITELRLRTNVYDSGAIALPCAQWTRVGSRKYEYKDRSAAVAGVERILWNRGVKLLIKLRGGTAAQLTGPVSFFEVHLSSGPVVPAAGPTLEQERYCARFTSFTTNAAFVIGSGGPGQPCILPTPTITPTIVIPTATPTITPTFTPTITPGGPTLTPTGTATRTATPTVRPPTSRVIHLATGSRVRLGAFLTLPPFPLSGQFRLDFASPGANGVTAITVPASGVAFDPILNPLIGINAVCVQAVGDGSGLVDCDGGNLGINRTVSQDHRTQDVDPGCAAGTPDVASGHAGSCNGPVVTGSSGTFAPGDVQISMTVQVVTLTTAQFGPDSQPCTLDDQPSTPPSPVTIPMQTGTITATVFDLNNNAGINASLQGTGSPFGCAGIDTGVFTGAKLVGGFVALHADPLIGDVATVLELVAQ